MEEKLQVCTLRDFVCAFLLLPLIFRHLLASYPFSLFLESFATVEHVVRFVNLDSSNLNAQSYRSDVWRLNPLRSQHLHDCEKVFSPQSRMKRVNASENLRSRGFLILIRLHSLLLFIGLYDMDIFRKIHSSSNQICWGSNSDSSRQSGEKIYIEVRKLLLAFSG